MKRFAELFTQLDQTASTNRKVEALACYLSDASDEDKLWAIALLSGRRPRRAVTSTQLREWSAEVAELPLWLVDETYAVVGDLAETISLVMPQDGEGSNLPLAYWIGVLQQLQLSDPADRRRRIVEAWQQLQGVERYLFNKLITGSFRVGVSQKLMTRALAKATGLPETELAHRIMGQWTPATTTFEQLISKADTQSDRSKPYPFFLAYPLEGELAALGEPSEWSAEYKWDGIRGQVVVRGGETFVWSRGEELVTDVFPEFKDAATYLADGVVIDGEILAWRDGAPLSFNALQTRLGRKKVSAKHLRDAPVAMVAYDLLEWRGADIRQQPFLERRRALCNVVSELPEWACVKLSPLIQFSDWRTLADERENARRNSSEGLMLKRNDSPYRVGRRKGDWWKWKVDPLTIDAVLIYAEAGHGRRANLYTDFTFAVWNETGELVPFTKAYSGLTDAEFREITSWVRRNTLERFGPVRRVRPQHVFEIAFEGIRESSRHKSSVALRFPRMKRWRRDKLAEEANSLADLKAMLPVEAALELR
ncbi:MAG: ATP-dependent DNA ligase [Hyphomicrobiaceae bacterium]